DAAWEQSCNLVDILRRSIRRFHAQFLHVWFLRFCNVQSEPWRPSTPESRSMLFAYLEKIFPPFADKGEYHF
ncbi:hypothetical protein, partial [uncultured Mailhella sp.]|uniref:hypothetical protein n=1 Tax=uncultured Mailhella sp. TaxID=1981031 RepID=UPI0026306738